MKKWSEIKRKKSISIEEMKERLELRHNFNSQIVETASGEPIYEGISQAHVQQGDTIAAEEKGNSFGITVVVFLVKIVDGNFWWYATEKESDEEPADPCDSAFMEDISS